MNGRIPDACFDLAAGIARCASKKFERTPDAIFSLAADVVAVEMKSG
jgi:hypothetical protein